MVFSFNLKLYFNICYTNKKDFFSQDIASSIKNMHMKDKRF